MKEIEGLINRVVFLSASSDDVKGHTIMWSRFVDYIKSEGTSNAYKKSLCFPQDYNNK